jgi:transposase
MVGGDTALEIRLLAKHGKGVREIAREVGVSRNTVRRYLRAAEASRYSKRPPQPGKLSAFEDYVRQRLASALPERLAATVLLRELRERGYGGGYTLLKDFVAGLQPPATPEPVVRFETAPGQQMQVDWATIRRGEDRLSVFVATLGWSRAAYVEFVTDERLETLLAAHEHAFLAFGGVPAEVLYDNMRTVVSQRDRYGQGKHRFQPGLLDFAGHCGFRPKLCRPYRAQTKGKVERFIRYLRGSFWVPLTSRMAAEGVVVDAAAANLAAGRWLREVANARQHATTGAVPAERLAEERPALRGIPAPYGGIVPAALQRPLRAVQPIQGIQHPLAVYDALLALPRPEGVA